MKKDMLLAPNGNKSNLTPEQYKLVRTPEFKSWFGDWEKLAMAKLKDAAMDEITLANLSKDISKVIDENGEPLVVYHGTYVEKPFYTFDFNKADIGFHFGTYEQAKNRSETKLFFKGRKSIVDAFFLNIKTVFEATDIGEWEYPQRYIDMFVSDRLISESDAKKNGFYRLVQKEENKQIREYLLNKYGKFVGFVYNNKYEGKGKSFIVLNPSQIKLADGSNTTFDSNNPDIRFKEGGNIELALNDLDKAPSVKYWMQPEFRAETWDYEKKGKPDSFVKLYDEKNNADSIIAYDNKGNLVGLFTIAKDGKEKGAFKIVVREDSVNKGWGKKILDEAEKQGIDIVGNVKRNSFSSSGRDLLRSWLKNKMAKGGKLAMGIKAEMEHKETIDKFKKRGVSDRQVAESIAKDHLKEDPQYYSKLMKMESKMKAYIKNGFEYFYDKNQKQWVLYPIDNSGNRIEWDSNDNPIEAQYFNNQIELNNFLNKATIGKMATGGLIEKYSQPKKYNSTIQVGQKYYDNRYGDFYTVQKMTEVEGGDVDAVLQYDKGKTRTESGDFLLYHIDAKQHQLALEQSAKKEPAEMSQTETIKPIKEGFTHGEELIKLRNEVKSKYGDKKGAEIFDIATQLINPNKNKIIKIASNGVVVKENDRYLFNPFTDTDLNKKRWKIGNPFDVTEQYDIERDSGVNKESIFEAIQDKIPSDWIGDELREVAVGNAIWKEINSPDSKNFVENSDNKRELNRKLYAEYFTREREKDDSYDLESAKGLEAVINLNTELFKEKFSIKDLYFDEFLRVTMKFKNDDRVAIDLTLNLRTLEYFRPSKGDTFQRLQDIQYWLRNAVQYINYKPELILANLETTNKEWTSKPKGFVKQETMKQNETTMSIKNEAYNGISTNVSDYKNPYEVNRAVEKLLNIKGVERESYTPEEINFLSAYSGYGGLQDMGKLSDEELQGIFYEFYTPDEIVKKMWGLAYKYGYGSIGDNSVFEPSVGIGAFLKYAPEDVDVAANEINRYSAMICHILYPNARTTLMPFEKNFIKHNLSIKGKIENLKKYSLVIGNPPYGRLTSIYIPMGEDKYTGADSWVEYFILRGLDLLQKDGLLLYIVGAEQYNGGTMFLDSPLTKAKKAIFEKADLIDAYRLPNTVFERTGVSSEIVIFKKR